MFVETIQLYEYFQLSAPEGARAELTCMYDNAPAEMAVSRKRPAMLILPGGGYTYVSDREAEPVAVKWMAQGYAAFVLRYSVVPFCFPTQLREACMAMRYIRENCERFEVDPQMIAAIGFSAGGHLCGSLGTMYNCPEVQDLGDAAMLRPDAIALCYADLLSWGVTNEGTIQNVSGGDKVLAKRLSIDSQVHAGMPPVYLWHTRTDAIVPCRNALVMAQALNDIGVPYALHIHHIGNHGLATADSITCSYQHSLDYYQTFSSEIRGWVSSVDAFLDEVGFGTVDAAKDN